MLLLLTVSCAAGPKIVTPVEPFSETFYAGKDLNFRDIEKLQSINKNASLEQASSAGLILGRHYVKKGQYEKGIQLLEKNFRETYLTRYMRFSGMLWLFDAHSKAGNESKALEYYTMVSNRKDEEPFPSILRSYCSSENVRIANSDPFGSCVETRLTKGKTPPVKQKEAEEVTIVGSGEKPSIDLPETEPGTAAEPLAPVTGKTKALTDKVFLIGGSHMEFMQAAVVAIGNKRAQLKLEMGDGFAFSSAKVDPFNRTVYLKSNTYGFDVNRSEITDSAVNYLLNDKTVTLVAASSEYEQEAERAIQNLRAGGVTVHLVNFEKGSFENEMKSVGNKYGDNARLSVLVLAPEAKLIKVVPLVRFSVKKPERVRIIIGTDSFGQRYLNDEYAGYFRRAFVFTPVFLAGNVEASAFREAYMNMYKQEPALTAYLANDIVSFLNGEPVSMSATDISLIDGEKAVRNVKGYRINNINNIERLGE